MRPIQIFAMPLTWLCLAAAAAQQTTPPIASPQRPVFRGQAMLVSVDVYPKREGRFVTGMTADDFEVLEDGVPQKVEAFEFVHVESDPTHVARDPNSQEEGDRLAADPRSRVFVVYFDYYHLTTAGAREMRAPLREFLRTVIGPKDYFGALTPDVPIKNLVFGQRLETLESALDDYWKKVEFINTARTASPQSPHEAWLEACYGARYPDLTVSDGLVRRLINLWRLDLVLTGLKELTQRLARLRDGKSNVLLFSGGWALNGPASGVAQSAWGRDLAKPTLPGMNPILPGNAQARTPDRSTCDAELFRLSGLDFRERFRNLINETKRANVSFSIVDPAGLGVYDIDLSRTGPTVINPEVRLAALRTLANETGGATVATTADLRTPLRRLAEDVSSYYLLGYYTTNTKLDGKFRKIEVRSKTAGVRLTARRGYVALTDQSLSSSATPATPATPASARATPASPSPVDEPLRILTRLRQRTGLFIDASASPVGVSVVAELTTSQAATWSSGTDVQVTVSDRVGGNASTVRGRIAPGARSAVVTVPLGTYAGPWRIRVDAGGGAGMLTESTELPSNAGQLSTPLLYRATSSARSPFHPVADHQFHRTERLRVEWTARQVSATRAVRLLDRRGQPLPVDVALSERPAPDHVVLTADLILAPLSTGDYIVELIVGEGPAAERSLVAIHVER